MTIYHLGQRVLRREERPSPGATVLDVAEGVEGASYRIAYDEGGEGWWPEACLEAAPLDA